MEPHILFFDIDGTIVDEKTGIIPESTKQAILQARDNGHILIVNTGRCRVIWPQDILDMGFHGAIGGCGTYIEFEGKELFHTQLNSSLCKQIAQDLQTYHIDGVLEAKECSYFSKNIFMPVVQGIYSRNGLYGGSGLTKKWDDPDIIFDKMALWFDETSQMDAFKKKYEQEFDFIRREVDFYEVVPKGYSKASGMEWLIEELGITWENTIAIGDSANDIPMFEYAAKSTAMKSDKEHVLKNVDFISDTVLNDGVFKSLRHFHII